MQYSDIVKPSQRDPYIVQIGLDFGTSYSKCVFRDLSTEQSWVYQFENYLNGEKDFLIPSKVLVNKGMLSVTMNRSHYENYSINNFKITMHQCILDKLDSKFIDMYKSTFEFNNNEHLLSIIKTVTVYYLAGLLGNCKKYIFNIFDGFGENELDELLVNMSIPVESLENEKVKKEFEKILQLAWFFSEELHNWPVVQLDDLLPLCASDLEQNEECYVYPEVSANMISFARSSAASKNGVYFFSDTGAGTVDQNLFILFQKDGIPHLTYIGAKIWMLGSSFIEGIASSMNSFHENEILEEYRLIKEKGLYDPDIEKAKRKIEFELLQCTRKTIADAKSLLYQKSQLLKSKVIFAGGGHLPFPYETGVMKAFQSDIFPEEIYPDIVSLSKPRNLDMGKIPENFYKRLTVAYGLSFFRDDLATFTYPSNLMKKL